MKEKTKHGPVMIALSLLGYGACGFLALRSFVPETLPESIDPVGNAFAFGFLTGLFAMLYAFALMKPKESESHVDPH